MIKTTTIALALILSQQVLATTYPARFSNLLTNGKLTIDGQQKRLDILMSKFPWLENLSQPVLSVREEEAHYQTPNLGIKGLPFEFISDKQLVYSYPDSKMKGMLAYVGKNSNDYEAFLHRNTGADVPSQALIFEGGAIKGRFLHIERPYSYMRNIFSNYNYDFENFINAIDSPAVNLSSGGYRLARDISSISAHRVTAFSMDIVGHEGVYHGLPYYLFGDSMNAPLPSDSFGAVIQFGGLLGTYQSDYLTIKKAIHEMTRLAKPDGYLLFEVTYPVNQEVISDATQDLSKDIDWIEFYPAVQYNSHSWRTDMLVEIKFME
ncbi:MAG: hypothetical protein OYH77_03050 [Pseudomonadota bacterium]|nr:hypothetical protein [Pseudomonadota bacterium]